MTTSEPTLWQVQAYDWPWHLAPAWDAMALCGTFVMPPARYWAAHGPVNIDTAFRCPTCWSKLSEYGS